MRCNEEPKERPNRQDKHEISGCRAPTTTLIHANTVLLMQDHYNTLQFRYPVDFNRLINAGRRILFKLLPGIYSYDTVLYPDSIAGGNIFV